MSTHVKCGFILATGKEGNCRHDFKVEVSVEEEGISVSGAIAQKFEGEAVRQVSKTVW